MVDSNQAHSRNGMVLRTGTFWWNQPDILVESGLQFVKQPDQIWLRLIVDTKYTVHVPDRDDNKMNSPYTSSDYTSYLLSASLDFSS